LDGCRHEADPNGRGHQAQGGLQFTDFPDGLGLEPALAQDRQNLVSIAWPGFRRVEDQGFGNQIFQMHRTSVVQQRMADRQRRDQGLLHQNLSSDGRVFDLKPSKPDVDLTFLQRADLLKARQFEQVNLKVGVRRVKAPDHGGQWPVEN